MVCSIFLDPQYECDIDADTEKVILAKITLQNSWERIKSIKNEQQLTTNEMAAEEKNTSTETMSDMYSELDNQYNARGIQNSSVD